MYITGLILGISSSLHCIGMCGPLAAALPRSQGTKPHLILTRWLYQLGRVLTYTLLGALAGSLGYTVHIIGWQRNLYLLTGALMLLSLALGTLFSRSKYAQKYTLWISHLVAHQLNHRAGPAYFIVGMLNGLLPCGMVFLAMAGAATTGSPQHGALYMTLFGLGTIPAMMAVSLAGMIIQHRARRTLRKLSPALVLIMGSWFIFRGLQTNVQASGLAPWETKPACCDHPTPDSSKPNPPKKPPYKQTSIQP